MSTQHLLAPEACAVVGSPTQPPSLVTLAEFRAVVPTLYFDIHPGGVHGFEGMPGELADRYRATFAAAVHRWL